jgi:TonB-linked SusC/RagA family outer membrane protein
MKKLFLLICLFVFTGASLLAQTKVITGTVTSAVAGEGALPGVTVQVKGTTIGALTDVNGKYSINAPTTATTLVFSYVGMKSLEVEIAGQSVVNAVLESAMKEIAEVVVTSAYGIKRAPKGSSSLDQVVGGEKLAEVRQINVNNALAGKVSGIQFRGQSGAKLGSSGAGSVRLRGDSGFGSGSGILYVVDGTVLPNSSDLNLDDIEDISVLSGPAASAILGSQGSNGAVIITTKKAKAVGGKSMNIELNSGILASKVYVLPNYQNDYAGGAVLDMYKYTYRAGVDPVEWAPLDGKYYPDYSDDASWGPRMIGQEYIPWYSWYPGTKYTGTTARLLPQPDNARDYYQTGITYNNNIAFNKVSDKSSIRVVFGNINVTGNIPSTSLNRNTFAIKTSYDITKRLTIAANVNFFTTYTNGEFDDNYSNQTSGSFNQWFHRDLDMGIMKELKDLRSPTGILASWNHNNPTSYDPANPINFYAGNYWFNFYTWFDYVKMHNRADRLFGDLSLNYKIMDGLNLKVTYRRQENNTWYEEKFYSDLFESQTQATGNEARVKGYYYTYTSYSNREDFESLLSFSKKFGDFAVNANAGSDFFRAISKSNSANTNNGFNVRNLFTISNSKDQPSVGVGRSAEAYNAIFLTGEFSYKDFAFLNFTVRNDWYSTLPPANNDILSKSFGGSLVFSDLLKLPWLSFGKVRASWGEIPTSIGAYVYPGFAYGVGTYQWGTNFVMGTPDQLVDPNIHGAKKTQKEAGLELRFLKNRIGLAGTFWDGSENDIPVAVSVSNYSGFTSKYLNTGKVAKQGLDLIISGKPFESQNFSWDINATFSWLIKQKVLKIADGIDSYYTGTATSWGPGLYHVKGMTWGQLFGPGMKRDSLGRPYVTTSGTYVSDPSVYFGSVLPKYTGGIQNTFKIMKDFTVTMNFDYQYGGKFFSLSDMWGTFSGLTARTSGLNDKGNPIRDAVADGGGVHVFGVDPTTDLPVDYYVDAQTYYHNLYNIKTYDPFIYDLTYLKLRELSIGYNIPVEKLGLGKYIQGATFSLIAQNPWLIITSTKDFDPSEVSGASGENGQMPGIRSFGANLKINF